jgi:predicted helicase
VVQALSSRSFPRQEFLKSLDRFYMAIEAAARSIERWSERQHFLNTVYERFFQGFSIEKADTHGIVYTPQEIVDFMVTGVDEILQREFGKSLATPGVKIIDPSTGTGNFVVNIMKRIPRGILEEKYKNDLFCNEIMLLPYYIASLNIEHEYYDRMGHYAAFEGICFADTLELAESRQLSFLVEQNTGRVRREKAVEIMVVMGNPPYNVGQRNEHDNNKNRRYTIVDGRVNETYAKYSRATNKNALADMYVKFFRWASDRVGKNNGIVCFVSNNGFINGIAFDGFRKALFQDFTHVYHVDLKGNARTSGLRRRAEGGNVFDDKIRTGIGITILVKSDRQAQKSVWYYAVDDHLKAEQKRDFLRQQQSIFSLPWKEMVVDGQHNWLVEALASDFTTFLPMGTRAAKSLQANGASTLFKLYSGGIKTNRDEWAYDFHKESLKQKVSLFIDTYNSEVDRWGRRGHAITTVDQFVVYDDHKIKWSEGLKSAMQRYQYAKFSLTQVREAMYRPFCKKWLFFDRFLDERMYQLPHILPTTASESENIVICLSAIGSNKSFHCLVVNRIPDLHLTGDAQCFPYYTYGEDGSHRRENITDWALEQFQVQYGQTSIESGRTITKWDIFCYVYAMLHHPQYRERYAENLKRDLPHIPLLQRLEACEAAISIGQQLINLHVGYDQAEEYALKEVEDETVPYQEARHIEKMKLTPDRTAVVLSEGLTLVGIPEECFRYRLGNWSALEWILDQYQMRTDTRNGILSDPNSQDEPERIMKLLKKVVTVSVNTVELVEELAQAVTQEDWSGSASNEESDE